MEENTNAKIDELNKKNIDLGGQSVQNESKEDIEDVKQGNKTVDMVERLMSRDEILEVARKNSLYSNMVGPCLAGNVSLDGRLLEFLNSPMKEIDLEDHITAAMNVLVYEISREQNGLVFNSNGTLNVYQSIEQSVQAGMPITSALKDVMIESTMDKLQKKYEKENEVGLNGIIKTADFKNTEFSLEDLFDKTPKDKARIAMNDYKRYIENLNSGETKEKVDKVKKDTQNNIEGISKQITDKQEEIRIAQENGATPEEVKKLKEELNELEKRLLIEQENLKRADAATNTSKEAMIARAKQAKITASSIFSNKEKSIRDGYAFGKEQHIRNVARDDNEILFMDSEKLTNLTLANTITDMFNKNNRACEAYRVAVETGKQLSDKHKAAYIARTVKTYYMCMAIKESGIQNLISESELERILVSAKSAIGNLIPGAITVGIDKNFHTEKYQDSYVDEKVVVDFLHANKLIDKDSVGETLREAIGDEVEEEINDRLDNFLMLSMEKSCLDEYGKSVEINQKRFEAADKDAIINYYNILRMLNGNGTQTMMFKMAGKKLEKANLEQYIDEAESIAAAKNNYYFNKIDGYMQERVSKFLNHFDEYYNNDNMDLLSNEDNMRLLSWAIIGNEISRNDDDRSKEIRDKSQMIIKNYLGEDVFNENGEIDQEKFTQRYIKYSTNEKTGDGKYRVLGKDENYAGILNVQLQFGYHEVERMVVAKLFDRVELVKKRNQEITNEEAKNAVDEKGEELDDSATKQPIQEENKENKTTDKPITQEEGDKAMADKGENMHVANPSEVTKESVTADEKSVDKSVEEKGNAPVVENMVVADDKTKYPVEQKQNKNSFIESIKKLGKDIKNMFKSLITGKEYKDSDSSSNNSSTSSDGGKRLNDTKENAKVTQQQNFVQTATISVKDAQDKVKRSKEKRAEGQSQENEVEQDENEI